MEDVRTVLGRGELIIGDGAVGTMLQAQGLSAGVMPEAWNELHPDSVQAVHRAYIQAGVHYITTNTFGGSRIRLAEGGLGGRVAELNRLAVSLAREVAGDQVWLAGSVGPIGRLMEPFGDLSLSEAEDVFGEQIEALVSAGVDLLVIETHHDLDEAGAALRMARQQGDLPVFCTFAFNPKGRTMMGVKAADAAQRMESLGATAVGANCGDGPEAIAVAIEAMRAATDLPLLAKSNAGIPQMGDQAQTIWDVTPEQMAEHAQRFVNLGARIIGGCCGSNPEHIAAIVSALLPA